MPDPVTAGIGHFPIYANSARGRLPRVAVSVTGYIHSLEFDSAIAASNSCFPDPTSTGVLLGPGRMTVAVEFGGTKMESLKW